MTVGKLFHRICRLGTHIWDHTQGSLIMRWVNTRSSVESLALCSKTLGLLLLLLLMLAWPCYMLTPSWYSSLHSLWLGFLKWGIWELKTICTFQPFHFLDARSWAYYFASVGFCFFISEYGIIILTVQNFGRVLNDEVTEEEAPQIALAHSRCSSMFRTFPFTTLPA